MVIRICVKEDISLVGTFYEKVVKLLDEDINYPHWIRGVYPSEESAKKMTEKGAQYVCIQDGMIVGAFALNDEPQGSYRKGQWPHVLADGEYTVIHALAVDPEYRNQNIASKIIKFCLEKTRSEGYKAIRVDIAADNIPARKLFEKNGFIFAGDVDLEIGIGDVPLFSLYEREV